MKPDELRRKVLMVAFHFPPFGSSSGVQRTLRFVQHLPQHGWEPVVLAPHPRAYTSCRDDLLAEIPRSTPVFRAFALDVAQHLALAGRYPDWLAFPDRANTWLLGAVPLGLRLIRRFRPAVLWSTYPVATGHLIAYVLARLAGIPWVADFRDPMLYEAWPEGRFRRATAAWVEGLAVRHASRVVLVTERARALYTERYPGIPRGRFVLIPNGYDESAFDGVTAARRPAHGRPLKLLHAGLLEPADRDPVPLFEALAQLRRAGRMSPERLQVVLRASGFDDRYRSAITAHGVDDIVSLEPAQPYREAISEMVQADGLLLIQGSNCNRQIPAKLYEYMRAGTPIFAIADPAGDTWRLLADVGVGARVPCGAGGDIAAALDAFLDQLAGDANRPLPAQAVRRFDRQVLTGELASVLDEVAAERARAA